MPVNLNQYQVTVGIFNNRFIICENAWTNLFHSKSYHNYTFILFGVLFVAAIYLNIFMIYMISFFFEDFHANCRHIFIFLRLALYVCMTVLYIRHMCLFSILVKLSGDPEDNLGSNPKSCQNFLICHWNMNIVSAHHFSKVFLLRIYIFIHKFDVICISKTFS